MAKKLKIVKLQAGFGNQMFQYAFGKALEHKLGTKVLFDKLGYDELQKQIVGNTGKNADGICIRKYTLGIFNLDIIIFIIDIFCVIFNNFVFICFLKHLFILPLFNKQNYKCLRIFDYYNLL